MEDCVHWVQVVTGECAHNAREVSSALVGLSSIGFWLVAQAPFVDSLISFCQSR